jgi:hypothetical protein
MARGLLPHRGGGGPVDRAVTKGGRCMNNVIYLVGLIVVIIAILSFFGLR